MASLINIGSAPDAGDGDTFNIAASKVNAMYEELLAVPPIEVAALNQLTLSATSFMEERAPSTLIGTFIGKTAGTSLDLIDSAGMQVMITINSSGVYELRVGKRAASSTDGDGTITIKVLESLDDGVTKLERKSTITLTITPNYVLATGTAPTIFVSKTASGTGDGSSWANAAAYTTLATIFASAAAGAVIGIDADAGIYEYTGAEMILQAANPNVTIRGMRRNYRPRQVAFRGSRAKWFPPTDPNKVSFAQAVVVDGISYDMRDGQTYAGGGLFAFRGTLGGRLSYICALDYSCPFRISTADGWNLDHLLGLNVGRFISDTGGQSTAPSFTNFTISDCYVQGASKPAYRFRGNSGPGTLTDCEVDCHRIDGDAFQVGFSLDDLDLTTGAHDITYLRCKAYNAHMTTAASSYWNADAFSHELGNYNIDYIDCEGFGCTDGGWDFKGRNVRLIRCKSSDNKRNFRIWSKDTYMEDCLSFAPKSRGGTGGTQHIWVTGGSSLGAKGGDVLWKQTTASTTENPLGMIDADGVPRTGILMNDQYGGNVLRLINVNEQHGGEDLYVQSELGRSIIMRASSAPTGSPTLTSASNFSASEGFNFELPLTFNRSVTLDKVSGDLNSFQYGNVQVGPIILAPSAYVQGGINTRSMILRASDIARNTVDVTVNVSLNQITDGRILDVDFGAGSVNGADAVDASPVARALSYGANTRIQQYAVGDNRLRLLATTPGSANFIVTSPDTNDLDLNGAYTIDVKGLVLDVLGGNIVAHAAYSTPGRGWALSVDGTGKVVMNVTTSSNSYVIGGNQSLAINTSYDIRVTRDVDGNMEIYVNNVLDWSGQFTGVPYPGSAQLTIGGNGSSQALLKGWIKRVRIWNGRVVTGEGTAPLTPNQILLNAAKANPLIGVLGASRQRQNAVGVSNQLRTLTTSETTWAIALDRRFRFPYWYDSATRSMNSQYMNGGIFANDGEGFTSNWNRAAKIVASDFNVIVYDLPTAGIQFNDLDIYNNVIGSALTVNGYCNNAMQVINYLIDNGKAVIVQSLWERSTDAGGPWTSNNAPRLLVPAINAEMQARCAAIGVPWIDVRSVLIDPASADNNPYSWATREGTHYTPVGAYMAAKARRDVFATLFNAAPVSAVETGNLTQNPSLAGTAGTATGLTGTVATGIAASRIYGTTATVNAQMVTKGGRTYQEVTIDTSTMTAGTVEGLLFDVAINAPTANTWYEGRVMMEVDAFNGWVGTPGFAFDFGTYDALVFKPVNSGGSIDYPIGNSALAGPSEAYAFEPVSGLIQATGTTGTFQIAVYFKPGTGTTKFRFTQPQVYPVSEPTQLMYDNGNTATPLITSSASLSVPEEASFIHTLQSNKPGSWAISGADAAQFGAPDTHGRMLISAKDFELPSDSGSDNVYNVTVTLSPFDLRDSPVTQSLVMGITNVDDGFTDLFNGTTGTDLADYSTNWTRVGGASGAIIIASGTNAQNVYTVAATAYLCPQQGVTDEQRVQTKVATVSAKMVRCLRIVDELNYLGFSESSGNIVFTRVNAGVSTTIATFQPYKSISAGDLVGGQIYQNKLECWLNDVPCKLLTGSATVIGAEFHDGALRAGLRNATFSGSNNAIYDFNNRVAQTHTDKVGLWALTMSPLTVASGGPYAGLLANRTVGSVISVSVTKGGVAQPDWLADGDWIRCPSITAGTYAVAVTEDFPGAVNTGRVTNFTVTAT